MTLTKDQTRIYRLGDGIALNLEDARQETTTQPVDHDIRLQIGLGFQPP